MQTTQQVFDAYLALSVGDRCDFLSLIDDGQRDRVLEPIDAELLEELERRDEEMMSGKVTPLTWEEIDQRIQARHASRGK